MNTTDNSIHVLLIEDNPGDVRLIREMLHDTKGRKTILEHCATLTQGLQALSKNDFSILLLDLTLPDSTGFDTFVKVYTQNPQIPIIVLTGTNDEELAIKSVRTGAQDYLIKGQIDSLLLSRSLSYAIERAGLLRVVQQELIERKAMESMLRKINRALRVLSECNEIVVRATEEKVLAEKICHVITSIGEYQYAWIAFPEGDGGNSIQPLAIAGSKDGNSPMEASVWFIWNPASLLYEAFKSGKVVVCDDVTVDKRCAHLRAEAEKLGYRSFVILPLVTGGKTLGVVQICSREPARFDREELKLLEELKEDIAYSIVSIRTAKERRRAEEEIKMLAKFPSENPSPILRINRDGVILHANEASSVILQYWNCSLGGCVPAFWRDMISEVLNNLERKTIEIQIGEHIFTFFVVPISDAGYVNLYGLDITDRKKAEEALRESEEIFDQFLTNSPVLVYIKDEQHRFKKLSRSFEELFGRPVSELIGKDLYEFLPRELAKIVFEDDMKVLKEGMGVSAEEKLHDRYFSSIKFPIHRESGKPDYLGGFSVDITEQKRAEETVRESEERFRHAFEYAAAGICVVGIDFKFQRINKAFTKMIGYEEDEIKNLSFNDITHPDDLSIGLDQAKLMLSGNADTASFEKRYIRKDKQIILVQISISLVRDTSHQPQYFITQIIDITKHRQMEDGLRQIQKLEGLGTLAGGIAHDFNNILGIILAYITSIKRFKDDTTKLDLATVTITKAVERGKTLVQQILTFARKADTSFGAVNVNDVVMEIVNMIYEMFPKTVVCSQNLDKEIPWINADRSQLNQILLNLCVNARDAMPGSGVLTINTSMVPGAGLRERHPDADANSYICIEVSDTGEGMTRETQMRIFEPFFTTKGIGKGTGLGLAVVFGIVQAHKGFIDLETEVGKGTTFRLYLPVSQVVEQISVKEKTLEEIPGGTETLLIVEDEEMLMMSLQLLLVEKGYKVLPARDGLMALKIYQEKKSDIALVITDLGLPNISGLEVCKKIKLTNPDASIILATGYLDPDMKSDFLKAGIQHFLLKPYDLAIVLKEIREVLDKK